MPDVAIEKPITMDLLDPQAPALSATSDMPVIETQPDATAPKTEVEKPAAPASKEASTTTSESATEHTDEHSGEPGAGKPARGVQKRLDELTAQREEAIRRAEVAEAHARKLAEGLVKPQPQDEPDKVDEPQPPQRPARESFADDATYATAVEKYVDDRAAYVAERIVQKREQERADAERKAAIEQGQRTAMQSYASRVAQAREKHADYSAVAESPDVVVSQVMAQAIMHSDEGPELAYHLGKNPAEAERISKLPPPVQLLELGKIAMKLAAPPEEKPAPASKPVSAAPAPGKPIKASDVSVKSAEEESMDEYAIRRRKELAASGQRLARH